MWLMLELPDVIVPKSLGYSVFLPLSEESHVSHLPLQSARHNVQRPDSAGFPLFVVPRASFIFSYNMNRIPFHFVYSCTNFICIVTCFLWKLQQTARRMLFFCLPIGAFLSRGLMVSTTIPNANPVFRLQPDPET